MYPTNTSPTACGNLHDRGGDWSARVTLVTVTDLGRSSFPTLPTRYEHHSIQSLSLPFIGTIKCCPIFWKATSVMAFNSLPSVCCAVQLAHLLPRCAHATLDNVAHQSFINLDSMFCSAVNTNVHL